MSVLSNFRKNIEKSKDQFQLGIIPEHFKIPLKLDHHNSLEGK